MLSSRFVNTFRRARRERDRVRKVEKKERREEIGKSRVTRRSDRGGDPSTPPPLGRERGYFTASPRQDRMTYFGRLLLSRGASSAALISNRKSRGEPRQTAGQSAGPAELLLHRPSREKTIADQSRDDAACFRGICIRRARTNHRLLSPQLQNQCPTILANSRIYQTP